MALIPFGNLPSSKLSVAVGSTILLGRRMIGLAIVIQSLSSSHSITAKASN
ncbi:MAG: hypothetical protein N5828_04755 [Lactobacillus iners]|nr:hypothetical protein [Lactobacillus iners]MCT7846289.1 hypothetical protein [Lactobacillus iners]